MSTYRVALLRGVNVGGHRKVPMADLRSLLATVGFTDVATYIQSGNVVFRGGPAADTDAEHLITGSIAEHFGCEVPVCVRSVADLERALERSATLFVPAGADRSLHDKRVHVGFLSAMPGGAKVAAIDPDRSPGDAVVVDGREAHIRYAVGAGSTKLTGDYLERVLGVSMTARNLATVAKLVALATP